MLVKLLNFAQKNGGDNMIKIHIPTHVRNHHHIQIKDMQWNMGYEHVMLPYQCATDQYLGALMEDSFT